MNDSLTVGAKPLLGRQPGDVLAIERLGQLPAPDPDLRPASAFHLTYWSAASGGSRIAAKLFIPEGAAPGTGWPVGLFSHGVGDPAQVYRRWPLEKRPMRGAFGLQVGSWAHHGHATLVPWLPGAGESEPLMTFSPLSLPRNGQALLDGFIALRQAAGMLAGNPNLAGGSVLEPALDFGRQVLRTDCMSSALLIDFLARFGRHPAVAGLKALVADDFQPSIAYNSTYLIPFIERLPGKAYAGIRALWTRVIWALADEQGWPLTEFFTPEALALFGEFVPTIAGPRERIYNSLLLPPWNSELGNLLFSTVHRKFGRHPTPAELRDWVLSPAMIDLGRLRTTREAVAHPLYRQYFTPFDPFFDDCLAPFDPGIPLLVVARDDEAPMARLGMPGYRDRLANMILPKIRTLESWGWRIELLQPGGFAGPSFDGGITQRTVIRRLSEIL